MAVEKAMGLRKGETMVRIHPIEIVSVATEFVNSLVAHRNSDETRNELRLEGFPRMQAWEFIDMLCKGGHATNEKVNRIEFRHLPAFTGKPKP